jgi:hypothetical protein
MEKRAELASDWKCGECEAEAAFVVYGATVDGIIIGSGRGYCVEHGAKIGLKKPGFWNGKIDLDAPREDLQQSEEGKIAWELINHEGRAIWIPKFVEWLFANYKMERKSRVMRELSVANGGERM